MAADVTDIAPIDLMVLECAELGRDAPRVGVCVGASEISDIGLLRRPRVAMLRMRMR